MTGLPQLLQTDRPGVLRALCARRFPLRDLECLRFGLATAFSFRGPISYQNPEGRPVRYWASALTATSALKQPEVPI